MPTFKPNAIFTRPPRAELQPEAKPKKEAKAPKAKAPEGKKEEKTK